MPSVPQHLSAHVLGQLVVGSSPISAPCQRDLGCLLPHSLPQFLISKVGLEVPPAWGCCEVQHAQMWAEWLTKCAWHPGSAQHLGVLPACLFCTPPAFMRRVCTHAVKERWHPLKTIEIVFQHGKPFLAFLLHFQHFPYLYQ